MDIDQLLDLYHLHRAECCKCGCYLESDFDLGSIFVLDYDGNFYCMNCDNIFDDVDDRIFEAWFYEDEEEE